MNYTIAVIASGIDEEYQQSILRGIHLYAAQHNVNIAHFIAFGGILSNRKYDHGEYNIYQLPNFSLFDGVILLSNTFPSELAEKLYARIRAAGIPAVSVDKELGNMNYIGIRNADAMEQITRHFIEKHGVRRFNYISGPDDNTESMERLSAFLRVLKEYKIPIEEERIFHGSFRAADGHRAIKQFVNSQLEMPQAIVCANDAMAISAVLALEKYGYSCPDDILVSGFDNIYHAKNFSPALTTVERPLMQSGALACQMICQQCSGDAISANNELNAVPIYSESCGCNYFTGEDVSIFKKRNYQMLEKNNAEISGLNKMSCSLVECDNFDEYIEALRACVASIKCEEFYLCLNDNWHTSQLSQENGYTGELPKETYTINGYSQRMQMPLSFFDGEFHREGSFSSDIVLPRLKTADENSTRNLYFVPLHFRERCLGYFAIVNSDYPMTSSLFHTWSINISNSLENFRKLLCLDEAVKELDKLYAIDSLTGIYNRNGFKRSTNEIFQKCIDKQQSVMIMFADMDGLKNINDCHGHKIGDYALRSVAAILQEVCLDGEISCRFGGDEFFIFGTNYDDEKAAALRNRIEDALAVCNRHSRLPYQLSVSIGSCITVPKPDTTIFQLISTADNRMYEEKKKKNPSKYLKQPIRPEE